MSKSKPVVEIERVDLLFSQTMRRIFSHPAGKVVRSEVTFAQMKIMWILSSCRECRMSDLASKLSVTLPTATSIVERVVKSGFAERISDKGDRRLVMVRLLPKGRRLIESHKKRRREQLCKIFSSLNVQEQRAFLRSLEKIHSLLEKSSPIDSGKKHKPVLSKM